MSFSFDALFQKILRSVAHRLHGRRDVAVTGQEDDRQRVRSPSERSLQVEPVHLRHLQVGDHAAGRVGVALREKFRAGRKRLHRKTARPQHSGSGGQIGGVVVHEEDSGVGQGASGKG